MSKKSHEKQLQRARAKRAAQRAAARRRRTQVIALVVVAALALSVFALAFLAGGGGDDAVAGDQSSDQTTDDIPADDTTAPGTEPTAVEGACESPGEGAPEPAATPYDAAPPMQIDPEASYGAVMETTCGTIELALNAERAPTTVNNFVALARDGYYDGVPFHRVIDGFMIQGGDPTGTGHGGGGEFPGYTFPDELDLAQEIVEAEGGYPRGTLAMANAGPDTNGSQFFIVQGPPDGSPYPLPPNYTIFGEVVSGMDVVDQIALGPADGDLAIEPVRIISVKIIEEGAGADADTQTDTTND